MDSVDDPPATPRPHPAEGTPDRPADGDALPAVADASTAYIRLLDCVDDAVAVVRPDLTITYANTALRRVVFATDDEVPLNTVDLTHFVHPDDGGEAHSAFQHLLRAGLERTIVKMRILDGSGYRPVEMTLINRMADPAIGGVVACFRNLTKEEHFRSLVQTQIELAERNRRLQVQLEERQRFLSRLVGIQAKVSRRAPTREVLQAIVDGAVALIGDRLCGLRMIDPDDNGRLVMVAYTGFDADGEWPSTKSTPSTSGAGGRAYSSNQLVVEEDYGSWSSGITEFREAGTTAAIAVPIRDSGIPIGSLTLGSDVPGRRYSATEREMLLAFAEHASLAIKDATTVEAIRTALTDALTGLPNRRLLIDRLSQSIQQSRESHLPVSVLFIDLDGFKAINDGRGHAAGDIVLKEMAYRIAAVIRSIDTASRLGGDEFLVVLEATSGDEAQAIAERILESIQQPVTIGDREFFVGATIGVTVSNGDHGDAEELVRQADIAMYQGKSTGRGRVALFEPHMERAVEARAEMESDLRQAIRDERIAVALQPIVRGDGSVYGVEALARWSTAAHGEIPPEHFIQIAGSMDLLADLDRCVLRKACQHVIDLVDPHGRPLHLHVNLSPQQLDAVDLVERVGSTLLATGFDGRRLTLEITETDALRDHDGAAARLTQLKALGVTLAVDDFGTGYSSLTYLERFPIDTIKIDREFTRNLHDARTRNLTESMIDMANRLGVSTVIEGVETAEQAALLAELGADAIQGFYISPPLSRAALVDWLATNWSGPAPPRPTPAGDPSVWAS